MTIFSEESRKAITAYIESNTDRIAVNTDIFSILEGELSPLLEQKLKEDLGAKSAASAITRKSPINYYRKVIDKLTSIYLQGVIRKVVDGTEQDQELVKWYEDVLKLNDKMNSNNENLNAYKYSMIQISLNEPDAQGTRKPFIRSIPNHEFLVMNTSHVDPTSPDVIILFMGSRTTANGEKESIYHVYSEDEFMVINGKGDVMASDLEALGFEDGINYFGDDPFVYANFSKNLVMPKLQVDDREIALLVPLLLTDLNYAVKFQAFSMFIAIDIDDSNIEISPNTIQHLKSDGEGDKPSFDTIKPTIDISEVLTLSSSQVSLWLSSKSIKAGALGNMGADQFASGISKMIDESDTFESRKKQIVIYQAFETEFWEKLLKTFHPAWVNGGFIDNRSIFSPSAKVVTEFPIPKPMRTRMEVIQELKASMDAGLESRRGALAELHPDWSEAEIDDKLAEIDAESAFSRMFEGADDGQE